VEQGSQATLVYRPVSYIERLDLNQIFSKAQPLELELGAGDGSFLIQWAKLNPGHNFLGLERLLGRLRKIERKARRGGLRNVRIIRLEASYFLEYLMPQESVTRLHVYFPDPWPKRKHWQNRLVNTHFTKVVSRVLQLDGEIFLRTDSAEYFKQMKQVFAANTAFLSIETPEQLREVKTDFERDFHAQGVHTLAAAYRRQPG
jgi:tRNA (guanine-N7-)-methyltransferase